jgi:hypothetical protein
MPPPSAPDTPRLLVALATYNRPRSTELALRSFEGLRGPGLRLAVYDDASSAYDADWLAARADAVVRFPTNGGIQNSRVQALRDFVHIHTDCGLLYLTDNDALHDPASPSLLRQLYAAQQAFPRRMPFGLYNSSHHAAPANIVVDQGPLQVRRTGPGISHCYDREMATFILSVLESGDRAWTSSLGSEAARIAYRDGAWRLNEGPRLSFDYLWPMILGRGFLQTKTSYVEHFAREAAEAGLHAALSADAGQDFEKDRALNPSPYLAKLRPLVIDFLLGARAEPPELKINK